MNGCCQVFTLSYRQVNHLGGGRSCRVLLLLNAYLSLEGMNGCCWVFTLSYQIAPFADQLLICIPTTKSDLSCLEQWSIHIGVWMIACRVFTLSNQVDPLAGELLLWTHRLSWPLMFEAHTLNQNDPLKPSFDQCLTIRCKSVTQRLSNCGMWSG